MIFKIAIIVLTLFCPWSTQAAWIDFEDLVVGTEFNYKPYTSQQFEFKASRYFKGGTLFYYDLKIAANLGNSNANENFLSIDFGSNSCLPGIAIKHIDGKPFDVTAFDIGRIYDHDGEFNLSLLGLDDKGKVMVEKKLLIVEPLTRINLGDQFKHVSELLVNAVYVDVLDSSVARFAVDNIDIGVSEE